MPQLILTSSESTICRNGFEVAPSNSREYELIRVLYASGKGDRIPPVTWRAVSEPLNGGGWVNAIVQSAKPGIAGELAVQATINAIVAFCLDAFSLNKNLDTNTNVVNSNLINSDMVDSDVVEGDVFELGEFVSDVLRHSNKILTDFSTQFGHGADLATRVIAAVYYRGQIALVGSQPFASFLWRGGRLFPLFEEIQDNSQVDTLISGNGEVAGLVASTKALDGDILILSNMRPCPEVRRVVEVVMTESESLSSRAWSICRDCADVLVGLGEPSYGALPCVMIRSMEV